MIDDLPDIYSPGLPITASPSPVPTGEVIGLENAPLLCIRKNTGRRLCEIGSQPTPIEIGHSPSQARIKLPFPLDFSGTRLNGS